MCWQVEGFPGTLEMSVEGIKEEAGKSSSFQKCRSFKIFEKKPLW